MNVYRLSSAIQVITDDNGALLREVLVLQPKEGKGRRIHNVNRVTNFKSNPTIVYEFHHGARTK